MSAEGHGVADECTQVFVSYRRLDDLPPPDAPSDRGFVRYLIRQLKWQLGDLGMPDAILWRDRAKIEIADDFTEVIRVALNNSQLFLAILSKNYVNSSWCNEELATMASRIANLEAHIRHRRIFRIDKHDVPNDQVPPALRAIEAVRFYGENYEGDEVNEYYWRGKVRRVDEYEKAVYDLAKAICNRLTELGIDLRPREEPPPRLSVQSNGPVVFVAWPASDMVEAYRSLVWELQKRGYRVTPDSDKDPGKLRTAHSVVVDGLAEAQASIHLLGERTGGRMADLDEDLVPMQLAAAAKEAEKRATGAVASGTGLPRMIWAPRLLILQRSDDGEVIRRDPLCVMDKFGRRLQTDQIDGEVAASRFIESALLWLDKIAIGKEKHPAFGSDLRLHA